MSCDQNLHNCMLEVIIGQSKLQEKIVEIHHCVPAYKNTINFMKQILVNDTCSRIEGKETGGFSFLFSVFIF